MFRQYFEGYEFLPLGAKFDHLDLFLQYLMMHYVHHFYVHLLEYMPLLTTHQLVAKIEGGPEVCGILEAGL